MKAYQKAIEKHYIVCLLRWSKDTVRRIFHFLNTELNDADRTNNMSIHYTTVESKQLARANGVDNISLFIKDIYHSHPIRFSSKTQ